MADYSLQKLFFDLDEETLVAKRSEVVDSMTSGNGKTLLAWSVNGSSFTKGFIPGLTPAQLLFELNQAIKFVRGERITTSYSDFRTGTQ